MPKFQIKQQVWYMENNKIRTGFITSILSIENDPDEPFERNLPFGPERAEYALAGGIQISEDKCFESREALIESL
jgi:hypothetical protein